MMQSKDVMKIGFFSISLFPFPVSTPFSGGRSLWSSGNGHPDISIFFHPACAATFPRFALNGHVPTHGQEIHMID